MEHESGEEAGGEGGKRGRGEVGKRGKGGKGGNGGRGEGGKGGGREGAAGQEKRGKGRAPSADSWRSKTASTAVAARGVAGRAISCAVVTHHGEPSEEADERRGMGSRREHEVMATRSGGEHISLSHYAVLVSMAARNGKEPHPRRTQSQLHDGGRSGELES